MKNYHLLSSHRFQDFFSIQFHGFNLSAAQRFFQFYFIKKIFEVPQITLLQYIKYYINNDKFLIYTH
ncbi:hypothetical protein pb186bvf_018944 [Paramecium bursaria]